MRKIIKLEGNAAQPVQRKRVAAYARVSSGKDAMLTPSLLKSATITIILAAGVIGSWPVSMPTRR